MHESLPHQNCVAHSLFGNWYHLVVEHNSLVFLELDVLVESYEYLCLASQFGTFLESVEDEPIFYFSVRVEAERHDGFLRKSIVPHQLGTFSQNSLALEMVQRLFPSIEDPLRLDFEGILSLDSIEVSFVEVFDQLSDESALGSEFVELPLFLQQVALESSLLFVNFAGPLQLAEHVFLEKLLRQMSFLSFFDCLGENPLPHHCVASSH